MLCAVFSSHAHPSGTPASCGATQEERPSHSDLIPGLHSPGILAAVKDLLLLVIVGVCVYTALYNPRCVFRALVLLLLIYKYMLLWSLRT